MAFTDTYKGCKKLVVFRGMHKVLDPQLCLSLSVISIFLCILYESLKRSLCRVLKKLHLLEKAPSIMSKRSLGSKDLEQFNKKTNISFEMFILGTFFKLGKTIISFRRRPSQSTYRSSEKPLFLRPVTQLLRFLLPTKLKVPSTHISRKHGVSSMLRMCNTLRFLVQASSSAN
jgi:hypothetical protein